MPTLSLVISHYHLSPILWFTAPILLTSLRQWALETATPVTRHTRTCQSASSLEQRLLVLEAVGKQSICNSVYYFPVSYMYNVGPIERVLNCAIGYNIAIFASLLFDLFICICIYGGRNTDLLLFLI